jgi:hypothetical protein
MAPISTFARIKPREADTAENYAAGGDVDTGKILASWDEKGAVTMSDAKKGQSKVFDHMAGTLPPDATQAHVYDVVAAPLVRRFLEGFDVDLLCYGQTGSGKSVICAGRRPGAF